MMMKKLQWALAFLLGVPLLLLCVAINRNLAELAAFFLPGSALWAHLGLACVELIACLWLWRSFFGGRRHLHFDPDAEPEERRQQLREFSSRLRGNPHLREAAASFTGARASFADPDFQRHCLAMLRACADEETRRTAERVFLATALSQNGRLDALIVFVSLCRLIWRIAHIYDQRPHPGDIAELYGSVATSAFLALSLEELDIATEVGVGFGEAFHAAAPATVTAGLPFVGAALQKFTSSAIDGAANCYLALRTGIIARNAYAYAFEEGERPGRAAVFREAGAVLLEMSARLLEQMGAGLKGVIKGMTRAAGEKTADAGRNLAGGALRAGAELAGGAGRLITETAHVVAAGGESLGRAGKNAGSALGSAAAGTGRAVGKVGAELGRGLTLPFLRREKKLKQR